MASYETSKFTAKDIENRLNDGNRREDIESGPRWFRHNGSLVDNDIQSKPCWFYPDGSVVKEDIQSKGCWSHSKEFPLAKDVEVHRSPIDVEKDSSKSLSPNKPWLYPDKYPLVKASGDFCKEDLKNEPRYSFHEKRRLREAKRKQDAKNMPRLIQDEKKQHPFYKHKKLELKNTPQRYMTQTYYDNTSYNYNEGGDSNCTQHHGTVCNHHGTNIPCAVHNYQPNIGQGAQPNIADRQAAGTSSGGYQFTVTNVQQEPIPYDPYATNNLDRGFSVVSVGLMCCMTFLLLFLFYFVIFYRGDELVRRTVTTSTRHPDKFTTANTERIVPPKKRSVDECHYNASKPLSYEDCERDQCEASEKNEWCGEEKICCQYSYYVRKTRNSYKEVGYYKPNSRFSSYTTEYYHDLKITLYCCAKSIW